MKNALIAISILFSFSISAEPTCKELIKEKIKLQYKANEQDFNFVSVKNVLEDIEDLEGFDHEFVLMTYVHDSETRAFIATTTSSETKACKVLKVNEILQENH